ncbi:hypothetical protein DL98DRAFT_656782 [Cadophora sp. DSE1049]|nr:hypothetical protein DL98DRAFT_656782 [Cadophora sp. DSE1049]
MHLSVMATVVSEHHRDMESSVRPLGGLGSVPSAPASLLRLLRKQGGSANTNGSAALTSDKTKRTNPIRRILRRSSLSIATSNRPEPLQLESRSLSEEKAPDDAPVASVVQLVEAVTDKPCCLAIPSSAADFNFDFDIRLCPTETSSAVPRGDITLNNEDEKNAAINIQASEGSLASPNTTKEQSHLPVINEVSEIGAKSIVAQGKSPEIDEYSATTQHALVTPSYSIVAVDKK